MNRVFLGAEIHRSLLDPRHVRSETNSATTASMRDLALLEPSCLL